MTTEDAEILAALRRRVEASLRARGTEFGDALLLSGATTRELLGVVETLTRREVARASVRARAAAPTPRRTVASR